NGALHRAPRTARSGRAPGRRGRGARGLALAVPSPVRRRHRAPAAAVPPHGPVPYAARRVPGARLRLDLRAGGAARRGPGAALARLTKRSAQRVAVRFAARPSWQRPLERQCFPAEERHRMQWPWPTPSRKDAVAVVLLIAVVAVV